MLTSAWLTGMDLRTLPAFRPLPHVDTFEPVFFSFRIPLSSTRIRWIRPVNPETFDRPLSRVETFEYDIFRIRVDGRIRILSNAITLLDRVQSLQYVDSPALLQNNMAANQNVFAVLVGLRVLGKTPKLYSRLSLKFYILYTLFVGVRPCDRSK